MFFRVRKNMHTRRVRCYFVNAKIAHACTQFMYVMVVFMNAHNLYLTLNIFISSLFTFFFTKCYLILFANLLITYTTY